MLDRLLADRIEAWQSWSRRRVVNAVDAAVHQLDSAGVKERRVAADTARHVTVSSQPNGMAHLRGTLPATAAAVFDRRLTELAGAVCPADPRTLDQRRADALVALGDGRELTCECTLRDCPRRVVDGPARPSRFVINVIATEDTVFGRGARPGYLDGYGVIDATRSVDWPTTLPCARSANHPPTVRLRGVTNPAPRSHGSSAAATSRAGSRVAIAPPGARTSTTPCPSTTPTRASAGRPHPATPSATAENITGSRPFTVGRPAGATSSCPTAPSCSPHPPAGSTAPRQQASTCSPIWHRPAPNPNLAGAAVAGRRPRTRVGGATSFRLDAPSTPRPAAATGPGPTRSTFARGATTSADGCWCSRAAIPAPARGARGPTTTAKTRTSAPTGCRHHRRTPTTAPRRRSDRQSVLTVSRRRRRTPSCVPPAPRGDPSPTGETATSWRGPAARRSRAR